MYRIKVSDLISLYLEMIRLRNVQGPTSASHLFPPRIWLALGTVAFQWPSHQRRVATSTHNLLLYHFHDYIYMDSPSYVRALDCRPRVPLGVALDAPHMTPSATKPIATRPLQHDVITLHLPHAWAEQTSP
jgi:hypothetical protein